MNNGAATKTESLAERMASMEATLREFKADQERRTLALEESQGDLRTGQGKILAVYCSITAAISVLGTMLAVKWRSILAAFGFQ